MKLEKISLVIEIVFVTCCCFLVSEARAGGAQQGENCPTVTGCGNGVCSSNETMTSCPVDCGVPITCNDGVCSFGSAQDCACDPTCIGVLACGAVTTTTTSTTIHATTTTTTVVNGSVCGDPTVCSYLIGDCENHCPECRDATACGVTTTTTTLCNLPTPTPTPLVCNQNGTCDAGETYDNCRCDCPCPVGQHTQSGAPNNCCPNGKNFVVGGACSECNAVGRTKMGSNEIDHCCLTGSTVASDGKCVKNDTCYKTSFVSYENAWGTEFNYKVTSGQNATCLSTMINQAFTIAGSSYDGHGTLKVDNKSNGDIHAYGGKWYDDGAVSIVWRYLIGVASSGCLGTPTPDLAHVSAAQWTCVNNYVFAHYQDNKAFIQCNRVNGSGNYINNTIHSNTAGIGGGNTKYATPSCADGSLVLDSNCNIVKSSDVNSKCNSKFIGTSKFSFYQSTPLSLILDEHYDINSNISFVEFALNPNAKKSYWMWKGSEKSPLLVYDPEHTGNITSATQLFGNWTFGGKRLASLVSTRADTKTAWENGFEALATLDSDFDGKVSGEELSPLALWFDKNQDGVAQVGEVRSLDSVAIKSLSYKIDKEDLINRTVEATKGFERELNGKMVQGKVVDWSSEGSDTQLDLINKHLLGKDVSMHNEEPVKTHEQEYGKETKGSNGVAGMWSWNLDHSFEPGAVNQGFFVMGDSGSNEIQGTSIMEQPFDIQDGVSASKHAMVNFSMLSGTQQLNKDGSVSLKFTSLTNGGAIDNNATIDSSKKMMKGRSVVQYEQGGTTKTLKYSWTATKIEN